MFRTPDAVPATSAGALSRTSDAMGGTVAAPPPPIRTMAVLTTHSEMWDGKAAMAISPTHCRRARC